MSLIIGLEGENKYLISIIEKVTVEFSVLETAENFDLFACVKNGEKNHHVVIRPMCLLFGPRLSVSLVWHVVGSALLKIFRSNLLYEAIWEADVFESNRSNSKNSCSGSVSELQVVFRLYEGHVT